MTGFPINPPRAQLVDPQTGIVTSEWYKFFLAIQKLIGEPVSPFDDTALLSALPSQSNGAGGQSFDNLAPPQAPSPPADVLIPPPMPSAASDDLMYPPFYGS